jgi:hypothetical protein
MKRFLRALKRWSGAAGRFSTADAPAGKKVRREKRVLRPPLCLGVSVVNMNVRRSFERGQRFRAEFASP